MIKIGAEDIQTSTAVFCEAFKSNKLPPFDAKQFLEQSIPSLRKLDGVSYPLEVKIPKSTEEMLRGDFQPSRVVKIDKPIEGPFGEMWFANSSKGVRLLAGYKDGDSRYVSDYYLGDNYVHGFLGGATGQGKSVTLNALIYGACYMYAPWELELILTDAKIVEFKSIAMNNPMPQITAVAATGDADYLISVLENKRNEMITRNAIFAKAANVFGQDIKKIEDFRKVTGLNLPQIILIMDEVQVMCKNAGKKLNILLEIIDDFARLGRNTGFHFLMSSQEVGSDIPKGMMSNIRLRMSMGCLPAVSEIILGNDGAASAYGKVGRMILNAEGGDKEHNEMFRVPFTTPEQVNQIAQSAISLGKKLKVTPVLKFYDEEKLLYDKDYPDFLSQFGLAADKLYFGEPSFLLNNKEQCVKIEMSGSDIENCMFIATNDTDLSRFARVLYHNLKDCELVQNVMLSTRNEIEEKSGIKKLAGNLFFDIKQFDNNNFFELAKTTIYKRRCMLQADKNIFDLNLSYQTDDTNKLFEELIQDNQALDSELNRERFAQYWVLFQTDSTIKRGLGLERASNKDIIERAKVLSLSCLNMCQKYNSLNSKVSYKKMPPIYFWLIGADRVFGLGRAARPNNIALLTQWLQDCTEVNCRFFIFLSQVGELSQCIPGIRWFFYDHPMQKEITSTKAQDFYPAVVSNNLHVLFDATNTANGCLKFKKLIYDEETIV